MFKKWILFLINLVSLLLISAIPICLLFDSPNLAGSMLPHWKGVPTLSEKEISDYTEANNKIRTFLGDAPSLEQLQVKFKRFSGQQMQDNIFLAKDAMYENIPQPDPQSNATSNNANGMLEFVYRYYIPTYVMIVPTACAIKQNDVPQNAPLFNQRNYIDDIYRSISGVITSTDVYTTLFASMDEYIYYRTIPELTGLGGYYLYSVLGEKLSLRTRSLAQFEQIYLNHNCYGSLYQRLPYPDVQPDIYSYYRMSLFRREYRMTRYEPDGYIHRYNDIILPQIMETSQEITDVVLGGRAPLITIKVDSPYKERLLIFSDETVKSYIPFLAAHYNEIYIVDLELADNDTLDKLGIKHFDQVLFSYSVDTFFQKDFSEKLMYLAK